MSENIEYIVNEKGEKIKAIVSLDMLGKILSEKESDLKNMDKEKIREYAGSIKLKTDPLKFQRDLRNEWN
jgi:predicted amidohydrolase